jgi:hypothetical protein
MTMAVFLGGAKSRLLPLSVPFRFFVAAALFQILTWAALLAGADQVVSFRGGLGPVLAAVHLLTLGVLTMTAAGAAAQLLPVATRRAFAAVWPIKLLFWVFVPGVILLTAGMYMANPPALIAGSLFVGAALILLAVLLADNLRRSASLPVVSAYGWAALASLLAVVGLGIALAVDYERALLPDHGASALAHMILAGFGFMGLLAIGFSHVLIPMFALSAAPNMKQSIAALTLAVAALLTGTAGALLDNAAALAAAAVIGLSAAGLHLAQMRHVLRTGMRKRLGLSFILVRVAWVMLPLTLLVGIAAPYGLAGPNGPTLFGFLLLFGWLLTFLLGILQRIMPFLASMHATRAKGELPLPMSELAASQPLKLQAGCHLAALALLSVAIVIESTPLAQVGATAGLLGAIAFAWFTGDLLRRTLGWRLSS